MKICFFSSDREIKDLSKRMEGVEISIFNSLSKIRNYTESNTNDKILLFMDLDEGDVAHDVNREFLRQEKVIRIMITESVPIKTLKKHQGGKESAFGYIKKPLTAELVSGILNDFELADYVAVNDLTHEGDKVDQEHVDLTFVGITKPNLDDIVAEPEEEITQGELNEFRVAPPDDDPIDTSDLSSVDFNLDDDFDLGDDPINDEPVPEETGDFEQQPVEELLMSSTEEKLLSERGVVVNGTSSHYNSLANDKIQEKFDKVFGEEKIATHGPTDADLPPDQQHEFQIEEDEPLEEISINLDGFDSTDKELLSSVKAEGEEKHTNSFVVSMDEINLEEEISKDDMNLSKVIIEDAIIVNPEHDAAPASNLISENAKESDLVSLLDDEELAVSTDLAIDEISLVDIEIPGAEDDVLRNDGTEIAKTDTIKEESQEGGLKKGHVEDGYMFTGGDPSDANNWKEVK